MKGKSFSRSVRSEDITRGAKDLALNLDEHIEVVMNGLKSASQDLDLNP